MVCDWSYLDLLGDVVRVCVVGTEGSAPRHKHSAMILHLRGGDLVVEGSVGGGALEHLVLGEAESLLRGGRCGSWVRFCRKISLGVDLRQSCGGRVELLFEYLGDIEKDFYRRLLLEHGDGFVAVPYESGEVVYYVRKVLNELDIYCRPVSVVRDRVYLFGAGHVGRAVAYHLSVLDFLVYWVDFADSRFPAGVDDLCYRRCVYENPVDMVGLAEVGSYFLVMSHSHALDYEIVEGILGRGDFCYLGLIGSRAKSLRFRKLLLGGGYDGGLVDRLVCPVGLVGGDNSPHGIGISVAAQLLDVRNKL